MKNRKLLIIVLTIVFIILFATILVSAQTAISSEIKQMLNLAFKA